MKVIDLKPHIETAKLIIIDGIAEFSQIEIISDDGGNELTMKTAPTKLSAVFTVSLKKGDKPRLQSWLYDKNGKNLGGAYFVYITKP